MPKEPISTAEAPSPGGAYSQAIATGELNLARVDFYHYGLMRLDALDLIREAATT